MKDQLKEDAEFMQDRLDFVKRQQEKFVSELIELGFEEYLYPDYKYELDSIWINVDCRDGETRIIRYEDDISVLKFATIENIKNLLKALQS